MRPAVMWSQLGTGLDHGKRSATRPSVQSRSHIGAANGIIRRVTVCGHSRILTRPNQRWCGQSCRKKNYRERMKLLLKAAQPARAFARLEMKMAIMRERTERFRTDLERHIER